MMLSEFMNLIIYSWLILKELYLISFCNVMQLPLADDVDLDAIAYMTEGFSGADLQALLSDAQLAAVHEHLSSDSREIGRMPVISDSLLKSVGSKARPSISETEKQRLYSIYSQFLDSKKSAAAQVSLSLTYIFVHIHVSQEVTSNNVVGDGDMFVCVLFYIGSQGMLKARELL